VLADREKDGGREDLALVLALVFALVLSPLLLVVWLMGVYGGKEDAAEDVVRC
jgi:hypothetical protein